VTNSVADTVVPGVSAGYVLALRLVDVADSIDLARAETLWNDHAAQQPVGGAQRRRLSATPPKAVAFGVPPLSIPLDPAILTIGEICVEATMTARLYDFGAITLAMKVPAGGLTWPEFANRMNAVDVAVGPEAASTALWGTSLERVTSVLAAALVRPSMAQLDEDYLIGVVNSFDSQPTAEELMRRVDLAALLSGEQRQLSQTARADLLRHQFSYYEDDLVVLTWDRAFIYEPRGDSDVADVIEVANAQLMEMRYYDELLDAELPRMYGHVAAARNGLNLLLSRRYAGLARRLYGLVAEVTELTERVDNALQVTEDVYLARVYASALDQFRVASVTAAVNRKLAIIRETYTALYEEAAGARAEWLEISIVALIVAEVVMALLRH
jgi:hypothetical protein